MKKIFAMSLSGILLTTFSLKALPVGNPAEANLMEKGVLFEQCKNQCSYVVDGINFNNLSLRSGFYADYVFDKVFRTDVNPESKLPPGTVTVPGTNAALGQETFNCALFNSSAYFALNVCNLFDFFGTLGSLKANFSAPSSGFNLSGTLRPDNTATYVPANQPIKDGTVEIFSDFGLAWSLGGRRTIWRSGSGALGIQGQYSQAEMGISQINVISNYAEFQIADPKGYLENNLVNNTLPMTQPSLSPKIKYNEWQGGIGFSYNVDLLTPYIAVKWCRANLKMKGIVIPQNKPNSTFPLNPTVPGTAGAVPSSHGGYQAVFMKLNNYKTRKSVGLAFGATLMQCSSTAITGEIRMIDENAVYLNGQIRF